MITTSVTVADGSTFGQLVSFIHNSDYSGVCHIVVRGTPDTEFTVPCAALLQFAAAFIQQRGIERLQQTNWIDVLQRGGR